MICKVCAKENPQTNLFCQFCGAKFDKENNNVTLADQLPPIAPVTAVPIADAPLTSKEEPLSVKDLAPVAVLILIVIFFLFITINFSNVSYSSKNMTLDQKEMVDKLEKTRYKKYQLNIPETYRVTSSTSSSIQFTSITKKTTIYITMAKGSYGQAKKRHNEYSEIFDEETYQYEGYEFATGHFEYILLKLKNRLYGNMVYGGIAQYDNDNVWIFFVQSTLEDKIDKTVVEDAEIALLGAKEY